jgi:S-adenosylmethionine decarboxylase
MAAALAYSSALTSMVQGCIPSIVVQTKEYSSYEDELGSHGHDEPHDNNAFVPSSVCPSPTPVTSDDEHSGDTMHRDYTGMFEGPEKTLEVFFRKIYTNGEHVAHGFGGMFETSDAAAPAVLTAGNGTVAVVPIERIGLRRLPRSDLDLICQRARCTILSSVSNRYLDAYVLSESSLFVYPYMVVLKTCGTTTLLRCISTLIDLGRKVGLEIDWVGYSRKNFNYPGDQAFPHQSFHQELDYLYSHRGLCERLDGNGYTLGPVNADHWFVYVADHTVRAHSLELDTDRVLNIMMFDIDENVSKLFYYDQYEQDRPGESKDAEVLRISREQTVASGINELCPGAIIDPRAFEPCGYSMNAILFRSYSTIHITPESGSSYVSFETNQKVASYKSLISNVIRTFRPKRFVMTLLADEGGLKQMKDNPLTDSGSVSRIVVPATSTKSNVRGLTKHASFMDSVHQTASVHDIPSLPSSSNTSVSSDASATPFVGSTATTGTLMEGINIQSSSGAMIYKRQSCASIKVEENCCCLMGNWTLEKSAMSTAAQLPRKTRGLSFA